MIGPIAAKLRELVVEPQAADDVPDDRRVYVDLDRAPIDAHTATAEVIPVSSTPIGAEVGPSGILLVRNLIGVVVKVEDADVSSAEARRDPIVLDLMRRAVRVDWHNVDLGEGLEYVRTSWDVDYADLEPGTVAAWFTLRFTLDVEWKV